MQQACVDDLLMGNYSQVNDSKDLDTIINDSVNDVVSYRCEPFNCNGNGRCVNGCCICDPGISITLCVRHHRHWCFHLDDVW